MRSFIFILEIALVGASFNLPDDSLSLLQTRATKVLDVESQGPAGTQCFPNVKYPTGNNLDERGRASAAECAAACSALKLENINPCDAWEYVTRGSSYSTGLCTLKRPSSDTQADPSLEAPEGSVAGLVNCVLPTPPPPPSQCFQNLKYPTGNNLDERGRASAAECAAACSALKLENINPCDAWEYVTRGSTYSTGLCTLKRPSGDTQAEPPLEAPEGSVAGLVNCILPTTTTTTTPEPPPPDETVDDEATAVGDPHLTRTGSSKIKDMCCEGGVCELCPE